MGTKDAAPQNLPFTHDLPFIQNVELVEEKEILEKDIWPTENSGEIKPKVYSVVWGFVLSRANYQTLEHDITCHCPQWQGIILTLNGS